jgi:hypothetical protein
MNSILTAARLQVQRIMNASEFFRCSIIVPTLLATFMLTTSHAQDRSKSSREERKEAERIQEAERDVKSASQRLSTENSELNKANRQVATLEIQLSRALRAMHAARDAAEDKLNDASEIKKAKSRFDEANQTYQKISQPLIERYVGTDGYKQAVEKASQAKRDLSELRDNVDLDEEVRDREIELRLKAIKLPDQLQLDAVLSDATAKQVWDELQNAQSHLSMIRAKTASEVEKQPEFIQMQKQWLAAKKELANAEGTALKHRREAQDAKMQLAKANNRLQTAKEANRRDDMNDKNRKKPK